VHYRYEVAPQEISQYRSINRISFDPGFSDGSGLDGIGQDGLYPYTFQEIADDSPVPAGLQHRLGGTIDGTEEFLERAYIVLKDARQSRLPVSSLTTTLE